MGKKQIGLGTVLSVIYPGTTVTPIGQIKSIKLGEAKTKIIETTTLDTTGVYETIQAGLINPGEASLELIYDPGLSNHKMIGSLLKARSTNTWKVTYPSTTMGSKTFQAIVSGLGGEIPVQELMTAQVMLAKSGDPGFATT